MTKTVLRWVLSASVLCVPCVGGGLAYADVDESHDDVKDKSKDVGDDLGVRKEVTGSESGETSGDDDEGSGIKATTQNVADDLGVRNRVTHGASYGPAGCGLGSLIFAPDSGFTQIFAATTNGTFGTQTFGITSGTSNCDDTEASSNSARAFVETNRSALAKEIARGNGESIQALSHLAGCTDERAVGRTLQQNFPVIFPSSSVGDAEVSAAVVSVLKQRSELGCHTLG